LGNHFGQGFGGGSFDDFANAASALATLFFGFFPLGLDAVLHGIGHGGFS
jgi:hypothetical protein